MIYFLISWTIKGTNAYLFRSSMYQQTDTRRRPSLTSKIAFSNPCVESDYACSKPQCAL